ncbi:LTA synthase family protein [Cohnella endophytica]|uniref:LTA synthase family protein n=1 Tax=Cohnella endophytica TaxID=2419778 RepID=A0A494Y494_9BACL|nr:LTA synthase family protein [Cohnella endophytica]RKP55096.1 LTA synthase family protein [Cohnella endophytica]
MIADCGKEVMFMMAQIGSAVRKGLYGLLKVLQYWPWGITLLVISVAYKLNELDHQFNVGGMNYWKWAVNIGAVLLVSFWTFFLGRRAKALSIAVLDLALSILLFSDLIYFRYFKDFISVPVLLQAGQVGELQASIWSLIQPEDWLLFADIPIAFALVGWVFWRHAKARRAVSSKVRITGRKSLSLWRKFIPATLAFVVGWALIYYPVDEQKNGWARGLFVGNWWNIPIYNVTGLLGFHGYDAYRYAKEHWFGDSLSGEQIQEAKSWFTDRQQLQKQMETEPMYGEYKGKNVLVVQAEAFQQFVIGQSIGGEEITPNLNELIGQSVYFPNFYHQTAQGRTSDADFATSCSMHPLPTGSVFIRFAGNEFDCAPSILKSVGYDATVHHAYDGSFWNRNNMYHNMNYDQFYTIKDYTIDEPVGWSLGDPSFFRQTIEQLKDRGKSPFYAMSITLSSHHPFKLPYNDQELKIGDLQGTILGDYVQAAHYVDSAVGELVADLKEEGLWDNTILMFYGDHDNSVYDWSLYEKLFGKPVSDIDKDRLVRKVPFFIHLPNDEHAGVVDKAVGQMDTTPTIMHLLGIPTDNRYLMGVSMLSAAPKDVVFRNGGFTDGKVYFVPSGDGIVSNGTCYDVSEVGAETKTDSSACAAGAESAKKDLSVSDRVIEHNLIPTFKEDDR